MPSFPQWSDSAINYDHSDHPDYVSCQGRCPLVVGPIVKTKRLTKVLMDGGSGFNIMYSETLDAMGIDWSCIRPSCAPFRGIVPGKHVVPIGHINLPVTFGDRPNFRTETLTFEVVDFCSAYHAILGWPCYAKFMAIPNYTYLKLKMPSAPLSSAHTCAMWKAASARWRWLPGN